MLQGAHIILEFCGKRNYLQGRLGPEKFGNHWLQHGEKEVVNFSLSALTLPHRTFQNSSSIRLKSLISESIKLRPILNLHSILNQLHNICLLLLFNKGPWLLFLFCNYKSNNFDISICLLSTSQKFKRISILYTAYSNKCT